MGQIFKRISERNKHVRINEGYCLICGEFGSLSEDHVPPKNAVTITKMEQKHVCESLGGAASQVRGVPSRNGAKFKTVCRRCNSEDLGKNDPEIGRVCNELTKKINYYFTNKSSIYNYVTADVNAIKFARAMIGHVLAATSVTECHTPQSESNYFTPLKKFVLGDDFALHDTHDIYYWFYPYRNHISAKYVLFHNKGNRTGLSLLSFFPVAFLITEKCKGVYPAQARKLDLDTTKLFLDLSSRNIKYAEFPFIELLGDQAFILTSEQAIVSNPIK